MGSPYGWSRQRINDRTIGFVALGALAGNALERAFERAQVRDLSGDRFQVIGGERMDFGAAVISVVDQREKAADLRQGEVKFTASQDKPESRLVRFGIETMPSLGPGRFRQQSRGFIIPDCFGIAA